MSDPHPMRYFPVVYCLKCRKNVELVARSVRPKEQAKLTATCHGEKQLVDFAVKAGTVVDAFSP